MVAGGATTGLPVSFDLRPGGARETWGMPSTHTSLHYHMVFSTKHREPWLPAPFRSRLHAYLGGVIRGLDGVADAVGGVHDHVRDLLQRGLVEYDEAHLW